MNDTERDVRDFLQEIGLECTRLPVSQENGVQTADFRAVSEDGFSYVIEVKEKLDSNELRDELENQHVVEDIQSLDRWGTMANVISEASAQLRSTAGEGELCIAWIVHSGITSSVQHERLLCTLYGLQHLNDVGDPNATFVCYYYWRPLFARRSRLDAVVSQYVDRGCRQAIRTLLLNPFSDRMRDVKMSWLGRWFAANARVLDVDELRAAAHCLFHDGSFDNNDTQALARVRNAYGRPKLVPLRIASFMTILQMDPKE